MSFLRSGWADVVEPHDNAHTSEDRTLVPQPAFTHNVCRIILSNNYAV